MSWHIKMNLFLILEPPQGPSQVFRKEKVKRGNLFSTILVLVTVFISGCSQLSLHKRGISSYPHGGKASCFEQMSNLLKVKKKASQEKLKKDYKAFVSTLFPREKERASKELEELIKGKPRGKYAKKFLSRQKKFDQYYENTLKNLQKKYPNRDKRSLQKLAIQKTSRYQKIFNGCHTKGMTEEHKVGAKAFTAFTIGISSVSSGAFYTYQSSDDEDFLTKDFYGKLGYEMVADGIWAFLASMIFKDPTGSFLGKSVKMYFADNSLVAADAFTWEALFGEGEEAAREEIERILSSPEKKAELEKLNAALKREAFFDRVKEKFIQIIGSDIPNEDLDFTNENLDLEDPEVQDQLMEAALISLYEGEKGEVSLGSYGLDRYAYYSGVGIPFMFLDAIVSLTIYKTMCMAPLNPKMALAKSALIFSAYSVFYDMINYPLRERLINQ